MSRSDCGPLRIDCRARKFVEVSRLRDWELMEGLVALDSCGPG